MEYEQYVKIEEPAKYMEYSVYYRLGGINYFTGENEKRGIVFQALPIEKDGNYKKFTAFTGKKILLEELKRKSNKKLEKYAKILEQNIDKIHDLCKKNDIFAIKNIFVGE